MITVEEELPLELYEAPRGAEEVFIPVPYLERENLRSTQFKINDNTLGVKLNYPPPYQVVFKYTITDDQKKRIQNGNPVPVDRANIEAILNE